MKKYSYVTGKENFWVEISDKKIFKLLGSIYESNPKKEEIDAEEFELNFCIPFKKNKVIGLAFNYKSMMNNKENFDEPLIFLKSNTSLISDNNEIIYPKFVSKIWIEAELCLIIGKEGKNIEEKNAKKYILGHTCGNDVTAANIINRDWHLARSKALDTFAPIGPYLIKDLKGDDLEIKSSINGNISQKAELVTEY